MSKFKLNIFFLGMLFIPLIAMKEETETFTSSKRKSDSSSKKSKKGKTDKERTLPPCFAGQVAAVRSDLIMLKRLEDSSKTTTLKEAKTNHSDQSDIHLLLKQQSDFKEKESLKDDLLSGLKSGLIILKALFKELGTDCESEKKEVEDLINDIRFNKFFVSYRSLTKSSSQDVLDQIRNL